MAAAENSGNGSAVIAPAVGNSGRPAAIGTPPCHSAKARTASPAGATAAILDPTEPFA